MTKEQLVCLECPNVVCITITGKDERIVMAEDKPRLVKTPGSVDNCSIRRDHERRKRKVES